MRRIDPICLQLRPLAEYARTLPSTRPGKRIHRATFWRWVRKGVGGVSLRTVKLGGGRYTCDAWVSEFIAQRTAQCDPKPTQLRPVSDDTEHQRIHRRFGADEHGPGAA